MCGHAPRGEGDGGRRGAHRFAPAVELEQQLEATEAALLRARQDLAVEINQVGSATPSLDFWQHEAERLQRELTRSRFIPPRLEAADDKAFRKAGVH